VHVNNLSYEVQKNGHTERRWSSKFHFEPSDSDDKWNVWVNIRINFEQREDMRMK
jgi:hypothetical protein